MYIIKLNHIVEWVYIQKRFKDRTLLCILCSLCPTIYVNKHLYRLIYGRVPTKGSYPVVTRNRRFRVNPFLVIITLCLFCLIYACQYKRNSATSPKSKSLPQGRPFFDHHYYRLIFRNVRKNTFQKNNALSLYELDGQFASHYIS